MFISSKFLKRSARLAAFDQSLEGSGMSETKSRAWRIERFGADGPKLFEKIPALLQECHDGMAGAQQTAPVKALVVYGGMSRSVHEQFAEQIGLLPTAQLYHPKGAYYRLPVINGTALFPWRYAHDAVTGPKEASFGPKVSATRKEILTGDFNVDAMLPFDDDAPLPEVAEEEAADIERYREQFREAAATHPLVTVGYASNPAALLNIFLADVKGLRADGTLELGYLEWLEVRPTTSPEQSRKSVENDRPNFASGPLRVPVISARSKGSTRVSGTNGA
jgi:hypothetical protein